MQRQGQESSIWVAVTDEDTRVHRHTHKQTHAHPKYWRQLERNCLGLVASSRKLNLL